MGAQILARNDAAARKRFYQAGFWRDETYYGLVRSHARRAPDSYAVRDSSRRLTYRQLLDRADALADELALRGVRAGERVVSWLPGRIESTVIHIACSRGGYVYCPSPDRNHTVAEVIALLTRIRATAFFYEPGYGADAAKVDVVSELAKAPSLRAVYRVEAPGAQPKAPFAEFTALDQRQRAPAWIDDDPDRVRYLSFTSGSTGAPKGVMHSDNTLIAVLRNLCRDWNFDSTTVVYALSPISHGLGIHGWLASLVVGGEFVLHDLPRGASIVERIIETGTGYLVGVPTHAIDLLDELRVRGSTGLENLKCFRVSGAAMPGPAIEELLRYGIRMQSGYGMTENCAHQYTRPGDSASQIMTTCGQACACYDVRIFDVDDADRPVAPGAVGQLGGKGASLMLGYYGDQAATEAAFNSDGWFMTGDLARHDEHGYLHIVGRMKDMIIRGGHNINPGRIEDYAMRHDALLHAAAFPIPDERLGERICLAVTYRPGKSATADEILQHMEDAGLSRYEIPEFFVALLDMPIMTNGKIRKADLVKQIGDGRILPERARRRGA